MRCSKSAHCWVAGSFGRSKVYAFGMVLALPRQDPRVIVRAASDSAAFLRDERSRLVAFLGDPKCFNMVVSPGRMLGEVFRRTACGLTCRLERAEAA